MLNALKGLGTKFLSWAVGEGGRTVAKQVAVNQATKQALVGVEKADDAVNDLLNKGYDPVSGRKSGENLSTLARGQKKMGFFGSLGVSVLIGIGVSLLVPGAGFIAVGIVQGLGTTAVEAGVGALTDDETPTPEPEGPPVTGTVGDDEPSVQSNTPPEDHEPAPTPFIYSNVTAEPHEEPPCDENDPHGGCYNPPHEDPHEEPPMDEH